MRTGWRWEGKRENSINDGGKIMEIPFVCEVCTRFALDTSTLKMMCRKYSTGN